ncbi:DMT family transporter [Roseomonas chloroacetimidivorans]|uniref:DMT family transporter n=1 Tax=Roseomonas chloroacetimidivorans TaxID=1766656 RepID=UPI003C7890E8
MRGWSLWWRLLVISAFWASSYPVVRYAAGFMPPFAFSLGRSVAAAVILLGSAWGIGAFRGLRGGFWRHGAVLGTCNGWLANCLTAVALASLGAASVVLIQASSPLFVGVLAFLFLPAERPGPKNLLGMGLGFAGIALILGPSALSGEAGFAAGWLMLVVALSYAVGTVYVRRVRPGAPIALSAGQQVVGAIGSGGLMLAFEPAGSFDQPWPIWAAMLWVGVFASAVPLTLYLSLVQRARATDAAMTAYLQPGFAAVFAALLLGEWPEWRVLAGGLVVLAGVWMVTVEAGRGR